MWFNFLMTLKRSIYNLSFQNGVSAGCKVVQNRGSSLRGLNMNMRVQHDREMRPYSSNTGDICLKGKKLLGVRSNTQDKGEVVWENYLDKSDLQHGLAERRRVPKQLAQCSLEWKGYTSLSTSVSSQRSVCSDQDPDGGRKEDKSPIHMLLLCTVLLCLFPLNFPLPQLRYPFSSNLHHCIPIDSA